MNFQRPFTVAYILSSVLPGMASSAFSQDWHVPDWPYRAILLVMEKDRDVDVAAVRIHHSGTAHPQGYDYRIFDSAGKPVPWQLTFHDPRRDSLLSFRCPAPQDTFTIYFGKPDADVDPMQAIADPRPGSGPPAAGPAAQGWIPRAGLVLTTLRRPRDLDNPATVTDLARLIEQSPGPDGAEYRKNISDGVNPFGDSDYFLSIYRGWIRLPADAKYGFCTASNESSFSFLDGTELVHWPGRHTEQRGALGQKNAERSLAAGLHHIEYYHEEVLLYQVAFLGYKPPESEYYIGIPDSFFPQPKPARVLRYEEQNAGPTLLPKIELIDSLWPQKRPSGQYTRFRCHASAARETIDWNGWSLQWDFGDGQQAKEPTADHIFLLPGSYQIKLAAAAPDGRKIERNWPLEVFPIEHLSESFTAGQYPDYLPLVSRYDRSRLSPAALFELANFLDETGARHPARETAQTVLDRGDTPDLVRLLAHLYLAGEAGKPQAAWCSDAPPEAAAHLRSALELSSVPVEKMQVLERLIRHLGVHLLDLQSAEAEYQQAQALVEKEVLRGPLKQVFRSATMAIGDAHLCAGQKEKAGEDYQTAEALAEPIIPQPVRAAKIGAYPQQIIELIDSSQFDAARDTVMAWYDQLPADMPRGEILFWLGKEELLGGCPAAAIRPLKVACPLVQGSPFEAEAGWLLAEAYRQSGDTNNQMAALDILVRSGLNSPWREKAVQQLKTLKQE
ncbi:MAG: PKD domain protein [Planctomycetes bacterium ADurb.Bin412]|nr:MAG: PKD domain protein [Planctomycetes bacterium ADurb.Bin412]